MYRVFVAQNQSGSFHIDFSQNILSSIRKLNKKLEKRKKRDRWRLVWFSDTFEMKEARGVVQKLKRVHTLQAMRAVMEEYRQDKTDVDASLETNVSAMADHSSGF